MLGMLTRWLRSLILFPFWLTQRADGQTTRLRTTLAAAIWGLIWLPGLWAGWVMVACRFSPLYAKLASQPWFAWGIVATAVSVALIIVDRGVRRVRRLATGQGGQRRHGTSARFDYRSNRSTIVAHAILLVCAVALVSWWGIESRVVSRLRVTFAPICVEMVRLAEAGQRGNMMAFDESQSSGPPLVAVYLSETAPPECRVCTSGEFARRFVPASLAEVETVAEITQMDSNLYCRLINWRTKTCFAETGQNGVAPRSYEVINRWGDRQGQSTPGQLPWNEINAWIIKQMRGKENRTTLTLP